MQEVLTFLVSGCAFGLAGGFSPGPTTALVVAQTLRFGVLEGSKVAIAPALTDAPIVVVAVALIGQLARFQSLLGLISLMGAGFLVYLAVDSLRVRGLEVSEADAAPRSIRRGFMANLLNPHPYLFWFVIGAPTLLRAWNESAVAAALFICGLYVCLIGAKVLLALLVGRSRSFLRSRGYVLTNRLLGMVLLAYAMLFVRDGLQFLGLWTLEA